MCTYSTLILKYLVLNWVLDGHPGDNLLGERRDVLLYLLTVSVEMPSFLQPIWDAVQKRANGLDWRLPSLESSACKVGSWLALGNLQLGG